MTNPSPWRLQQGPVPTPRDQVGTVSIAPHLFTREECEQIVTLAKAEGIVKGGTGEAMETSAVRDSEICFLWPDENTAWIFQRLEHLTNQMNRSYQFDLKGFFEGVQVARYTAGSGGHYDWHMDLGTGPFSARKLSLSVQLSDPQNYEGGKLEFTSATLQDEARLQGAAIIFPAFMTHQVKPVSSGERWSMVCWISGDPFQ